MKKLKGRRGGEGRGGGEEGRGGVEERRGGGEEWRRIINIYKLRTQPQ